MLIIAIIVFILMSYACYYYYDLSESSRKEKEKLLEHSNEVTSELESTKMLLITSQDSNSNLLGIISEQGHKIKGLTDDVDFYKRRVGLLEKKLSEETKMLTTVKAVLQATEQKLMRETGELLQLRRRNIEMSKNLYAYSEPLTVQEIMKKFKLTYDQWDKVHKVLKKHDLISTQGRGRNVKYSIRYKGK